MDTVSDVLSRGPDERVQVLDSDGTVVAPDLVPDLDDETFVSMFRDLRFCRRFDERMISLQRQGRIGTYASLAGQEGSQIGSMYALSEEDVVSYQYREHGAVVARDFPWEYLLYWAGHEEGHEALADRNVFPLNISIADHLPHVTGMAMAMKFRDEPRVAVGHFGDGATSEGDFHEALNFAGVFDVPALFVCNNNQWAISTPRDEQTASRTFAQKADAYGFEGVLVDGMDPLAMYVVTSAAREKALDASSETPRPTLVEAVQYRYGAHTTADDPSVYRDEAEVEEWRQKDPLDRFEAFLRESERLDDGRVDEIDDEIDEILATAIDRMESFEADPDSMFEYVYENQTSEIRAEHEEFQRLRERYGDESFLRE
ncbi:MULTISPECIES: thiamine pyrophosphate-dependent dehydrogenase E1 component subunit alpha [Haloferax]|uniref:Pyruvate dehydrogenase (Acetyl-transferring) E1 component subunit alpha n=1 Tax=Haloferax marinum TaxID=2666143 RepID=A0A6A8GA72_9EURY|nr:MULTISPECIES: thiamine pyrophosphate-dependent dehydrogenase E1 component subunit alpha [Haloferax]KAB1198691.1 thiamine pyrophosphate-dependent dehydrogenase E1 component subunit alpha [Haloferax sp. CBA1150]MRW97807.1 pyruvate dehydrogenase (acetyl-transferring) E1 component subunit alpha [Haloferax marinum]